MKRAELLALFAKDDERDFNDHPLKDQIIALMGAFHTNRWIHKWLEEQCKPMPLRGIAYLRNDPANREALNLAREAAIGKLQDIAIADKRVRLLRLQALQQKAKRESNLDAELRILEQARKEVDGKADVSIYLDQSRNVNVQMSDQQTLEVLTKWGLRLDSSQPQQVRDGLNLSTQPSTIATLEESPSTSTSTPSPDSSS